MRGLRMSAGSNLSRGRNQNTLQNDFNRKLKKVKIPMVNEVKETKEQPLSLKLLYDIQAYDLIANKHINLPIVNRIAGFKDKRTLWGWEITGNYLQNSPLYKMYD